MQFPGTGKPPVGIVLDTDIGDTIDDALALALLYGLEGKNEVRVVSISVSRPMLEAAAFCEVVGRFYAGTVDGAFASFRRALPVGLATEGRNLADAPMLSGPLGRRNADGAPTYAHGIHHLNDTAEVPALIRNAFTAQHDQNAIAVLAGPATNLVRTLALPGVKALVSRKVKLLTVSGGSFPDGAPEPAIQADIAAAKKLFAEWPGPIVACGREIGDELLYPASSIEKDFAWSAAHPVADAYRAHKTMPYDAPTHAMAAVLHAVRPQEGYFKLSEPGTISVLDDGRTRFTPSADGRHRYLILDPAQKERVLKTYTEIASAKPVPRPARFRSPQQQQQQQQRPPQPPPQTPPPKPPPI